MTQYDYIIIGAGAAGLMLADAMGKDAFFKDRSILLLDKDAKKTNDRTWCFWEKGEGQFDSIVHRAWNHIYFCGQKFSKRFPIAPYTYKMVRGIDFYMSLFERINNYPNITFKRETVQKVEDLSDHVLITTDTSKYKSRQVFNSMFNYKMATHQKRYPVLQQHFLGWFVKTDTPVFNVDQATYMDFSIPQKGNTRFMYVLPFSETEALVEYTLFSEVLLKKGEYEQAIDHYIKVDLNCANYKINEKEQGSIPMTCFDFSEYHTANIRYIGTPGGWAKPSTGYTFLSTSKKVPVLLEYLKTGKPLNLLSFKNRFWYYDLLFLDVLAKNNGSGHRIFESLFKNRNPQLIFEFLDEETAMWEDIYYILGCPKNPFISALINRLTYAIP